VDQSACEFRGPTLHFVALGLLLFAPVLWLSRISTAALAGESLILATYLVGVIWIPRLSVGASGLVINRMFRLGWADIASARARTVLGLPYVQAKRKSGRSYWIPLYFVGGGRVSECLLKHAPSANPIAHCLRDAPSA